MHEFLFKNENSIARAMDTYQFDLMAEQILNSEWSVVKREN